jgi:hypothetical protein
MAVELVERFAILVAVVASLAWVQRILVHCVLKGMSAYNILFVDLLLFTFEGFLGMCGENSFNVFLLLFMVFWVLIFAMLCIRVVLYIHLQRYAFMFHGLGKTHRFYIHALQLRCALCGFITYVRKLCKSLDL